jgi:ankyrin repeat protein
MNVNALFNLSVLDMMLNAIDTSQYENMNHFFKYYSPINKSYLPFLNFIASLNHKYLMKSLINHPQFELSYISEVNVLNRESIFHIAVKNNDISVVRFLLEKGLDPNIQGQVVINEKAYYNITPIHLACYYGFQEIVQILIDAKANINCVCYVIIEADNMVQGNIGNEIKLCNISPMHLACCNGQIEVIKLLLSNNAKFKNYSIIDGKSILEQGNIMHFAAIKAHKNILNFIQQ